MLRRLRAYRSIAATLAFALLLSSALPLVQHACAMAGQSLTLARTCCCDDKPTEAPPMPREAEDALPCHDAAPAAPATPSAETHAAALHHTMHEMHGAMHDGDCCEQEIQQGDVAHLASSKELPPPKPLAGLTAVVLSASALPAPTHAPVFAHKHPPHAPPLGLHLLYGVLLS